MADEELAVTPQPGSSRMLDFGKLKVEATSEGRLAWFEVNDERGHFKLTGDEVVRMVKVRKSAQIYQAYLDERGDAIPTEDEVASAMTFMERLGSRMIALTVAREHRHSESIKRAAAMPTGLDEPQLLAVYRGLAVINQTFAQMPGIAPEARLAFKRSMDDLQQTLRTRLRTATPAHISDLLEVSLRTIERDARADARKSLGLDPEPIVLRPDPVGMDSASISMDAPASIAGKGGSHG